MLGIQQNLGSLERYLAGLGQAPLQPEIIDAPDSCGRQHLRGRWRAGGSRLQGVLLQYGADACRPRPSLRGQMPLLHLAMARPTPTTSSERDLVEVVRLLLEAGAEVNGVDHEGWTPLHVAASWNSAGFIDELARFAGSTLSWDAQTNDGQTAEDLAHAAGFNQQVQNMFRNCVAAQGGDDYLSDSESEQFFDSVETCQQG